MTRKLLLSLFGLCLISVAQGQFSLARACAGYTITVGSSGSLEQELLTQILSVLINQRTGTTIQVLRFSSQEELFTAASRHEVDLLVADVESTAAKQLLGDANLQLLEPFGYRNDRVVPVFQVATLKRFPALKRLVCRLGGLIDDAALARLQAAAAKGGNLRDVAKAFLAKEKLIFGG